MYKLYDNITLSIVTQFGKIETKFVIVVICSPNEFIIKQENSRLFYLCKLKIHSNKTCELSNALDLVKYFINDNLPFGAELID